MPSDTSLTTWEITPTDRFEAFEAFDVQVLVDTENMVDETGYERIVIASGWNPWASDQLVKVHYRIDQHPGASYAKAEFWEKELGWLDQGTMPVAEFWSWMPGFRRAETERANRQGRTILKDLIVIAHNIALEIDAFIVGEPNEG